MVSILITLFSLFASLVILALVGWIVYEYTKDDDIEDERTHGINLCNLSQGRAYGTEEDLVEVVSKRFKVRLMPRDICYKTLKKSKEISPIEFITPKIITFPKGTWSKEKNINMYLPQHANDLPQEFKETSFGKFMMLYIELDNAKITEVEALKQGFQRQREQLVDIGMGEVSRESMARLKGLFKDAMDGLKDSKKQQSPLSGSNMPHKIGTI